VTGSATGDLTGKITAITIDNAANQKVTVTFTLKDSAGLPVVGAEAKNFEFQIGKRVAGNAVRPAYWQSYINRSDREGTGPVVFIGGPERAKPTPVANTPGTYTYTLCTPLGAAATFQYYGSGNSEPAGCAALVANAGPIAGAAWDTFKGTLNLAYDPAASTRLTIVGRDGALVNVIQDFVPSQLPALPAAFSAQIVTDASCGACHAESVKDRTKLLIAETKGSGHLGRRFEVEVCVLCHNSAGFDPATSTATTWKTLDLKVMLHDLHAAEFPQSGSFGGVSNIRNPTADIPGVDIGIPAGARPRFNGASGVINCRSCHNNQNDEVVPFQPKDRAPADTVAWQTGISKQACGSCHDGTIGTPAIDFANHFGNQADNSQCALCHGQDKSANVNSAHTTPYSTPNNPLLYPGAKIVKYEITSLTVDAATGTPTVKFRVLVGDTEATLAPINLKAPPAGVCLVANCQNGNAAAGLNFRLAWARPMAQPTALDSGPAIAAPVDWNNFVGGGSTSTGSRQYWNDQANLGATKLAFDQPVGVNVVPTLLNPGPNQVSDPDPQGVITVVLPTRFPATPVYETLTLKAVALESYLVVNNYNISADAVMKGVDGTQSTLRRQVVSMTSCDTCHERIGFHSNAGRANNAEYCATCHNPQITSSNLFNGTASYPVGTPAVKFSQKSNNFKDMVHGIHSGSFRKEQNPDDPFNFIRGNPLGSGGSGPMKFQDVVYPARIYDCQTCHKPNTYSTPNNVNLAWSAVDLAPALGTVNADAGQPGAAVGVYDPLKTLRIGPAQAACGSCHNSVAAKTHFVVNSTSVGESCNVCHGPNAEFAAHK
jgi:OmcA/MtrC family decaheme c-type cytochrome